MPYLAESGGVQLDSVGEGKLLTVMATRAANLYLCHVWKLCGLPQKVVTDCRLQFIALSMKELYQLLRIEATSSTTYHPQMDRQTEQVNQELEQYLHVFIRE